MNDENTNIIIIVQIMTKKYKKLCLVLRYQDVEVLFRPIVTIFSIRIGGSDSL